MKRHVGQTRPLVAIVGPTASGKSEVAVELAEIWCGEVVGCDSIQVYRDFNIGAAKPTSQELRRVRHHLVDVTDWRSPLDAQRYETLARAAIQQILNRGREPLICGGTGLYLRALRFGLVPTPPADPALRERLEQEETAQPGVLMARLRRIDPESAVRIDPRNLRRVIRTLEIAEVTGEPASSLRARHGFAKEQVPILPKALRWPDEILRERIHLRTERMVEAGLLEEVESLLRSGVPAASRPMSSVGYKEACEVVRGLARESELVERISRNTWAYARRQRTWLRREPGVHWIELTSPQEAVAQLRECRAS